MKEQRVKQLNSFINENIIKRKAMFIPILGVSVFMLVGYAAVDKEAPKIVSNRIEVSYGDKVDLDAIDITDNQDSRPEIEVTANDLSSVNVNQLGTYDLSVTATDSFSNTASKVIKVDVVDDEAPKFKVAGVETGYVVQVPINGSQDISSYVTASDNVDGDVSPFIESNQELDTTKAGIQDIKLSVTDSSGNVNEKTFTFAVSDLTAPVVTLSQGNDIVIDYGSEFKLENFLTATDDQSAVTNTVTGEVDTKKENEVQTITVSTQDEAKNEVLTTLNFTVKDISGPQVNLSTNAVEVIKGDAFDPRQYLVSAIDNKDGDVTGNVVIGNIDTGSTGDKAVTYTVSDSSGNQTVATLNVKVYTPGSKILETAYTKLGSPYVWGATGPNSFDCSGFTSWVYRQHGISLSRTAQAQSQGGKAVDRADLQPGDLVFFGSSTSRITHVGIYVGNQVVIEARSELVDVETNPIGSRDFTYCLFLPGIEYTENPNDTAVVNVDSSYENKWTGKIVNAPSVVPQISPSNKQAAFGFGMLNNGTQVTVVGVDKDYYRIKSAFGSYGYVYSYYIGTLNAASYEKQYNQWVGSANSTTGIVNIRTGPSTTYDQNSNVPSVSNGGTFEVLGEVLGNSDNRLWYYVRILGQYYGYVRSDLVSRQIMVSYTAWIGEAKSSTGTVNIRTAPTVNSALSGVLSALSNGNTVTVTSETRGNDGIDRKSVV